MSNRHRYKAVELSNTYHQSILQQITALLNPHKNRVLQVAQSALSASQFSAFKKLFLDEFGQKGLESELAKLFTSRDEHTMARNGQADTTQERRCHHE